MVWYLLTFSDHKKAMEYAWGVLVSIISDSRISRFPLRLPFLGLQGLAVKLSHSVSPFSTFLSAVRCKNRVLMGIRRHLTDCTP